MTSPNATGVVGTYPTSGNSQIDPLVWLGFKWGASGAGTPAVVTYSFPTSASKWSNDYAIYLDNEPFNGFQAFTATQQAAAKQAMAQWSDVANITFKQVSETASNVGDIRFGNSASVTQDSFAVAWAYTPFEDNDPNVHYPESGDIWFDRQYPFNLQLKPGQEGFWTMLHEIGHAIGLDHPFVDTSDPSEPVLAGQDTDQYTVMSYTLELATNAFASTPQLLDILAIQYIYGANMNTRKGNDVYKFSATSEVNRAIWDAGGIDTLDLSNQTTDSFVSLIDGTHSKFCFHDGKNGPTSSLLGIAFGVTIENAFGGAGNDEIWGNAAANRLTGGNGFDRLEGFDGADRLEGGAGVDTLVGATGTDFLDGGLGDDELHGGSADDTLSGGAGIDFLYGDSGNDLYILDSASDVFEDTGGDTGDGIQASFLIGKLYADIENYKYTGAAAWVFTGDGLGNELSGGSAGDKLDGAGGDDPLLGNAGNDTLTGGLGNDALYGGIGTDKMFGGTGNDTYEINVAGDVIDEQGSGDSDDLVRSSIAINLAALASGAIEHAVLLGSAALNATGNAQDNKLTGNIGANKLNGSSGADTLSGGNGADTYAVDNLGDQVIETTGGAPGGVDIVVSSVDFELGANVEKLTLTGLALKGTGNELGNTIVGNNGNNILDGKGGNDTLTGGIGSDTYVVDSVKDVVNETVLNKAGGGVDIVQSSVNFSLATRANIENLILTGAGDISGTGNAIANVIEGSSGKNLLDGGAGADTLRGGAGNDTYVVDNANDKVDEGANADTGDEVKSSLMLGLFAGIENYTYTGTKAWSFAGTTANNKLSGNALNDTLNGADGDDMLLGNGGNDLLIGEAGNDTLDGGAGIDKMLGGAGNDTYVINALTDIFDEEGNADTDDVVRSSVSINLTAAAFAGIEHIELIGTAANATGNAGNNKITGNAAANLLIGGGGNDTLAGSGGNDKLVGDLGDDWLDGGEGNDTLKGGAGNDTYQINAATDVIDEETNADADDHVRAAMNVDLLALAGGRIEHATLTGTANINALGNTANNKLTGNDGANELNGGGGADTLTGGSGNDTYILDAGDQVVEAADGGTDLVKTNLTFSLAALAFVENLTLTGTSNVDATGNGLNNVLTGNDGVNRLDGGAGNDTMIGGKGDDTYVVDAAGDVISETVAVGGGTDLIESGVSFSLVAFANVENLKLTGSALNGTGNGLANVITGTAASNTLDGLGGADTLKGGAGNDIYVLDDAGDAIDEQGNADSDDLVRSSTSVNLTTLAAGLIEHAELLGTTAINATGNAGDNKLTGNDGANELDGGIGADTMTGGLGNDTYIMDAVDQVVEAAGGGTDLVKIGLTFSLAALAFVENLTLTGTSNVDATGNGLDNVLTGNDGVNRLDGGVGNDTMIGGKGDDTYVVDAAGDVISETVAVDGGTDLVENGVDFSLAAFANVENLKLTGSALNGTGNGLANILIGTAASNTLDGLGGADTLKGGEGNDIYVLDDAGDAIDEQGNADADDLVRSSVSVNLTALAAGLIEHAELLGTAAINATGNAGDNKLTGNSGDNVLDGGEGADTMTGGLGNDTYIVDEAGDQIVDTGGVDLVKTDLTFSLASLGLIEKLTLTGSSNINATGNDLDNFLTGNSGANQLFGGLFADTLDGSGGADTLKGGHGNDTYIVDDVGDIVDEEGNISLNDTLQSSNVNLLAITLDIENYTYTGTADWTFTGDGNGNKITGGSGNDVLSGAQGGDTLIGGEGDDILYGDGPDDWLFGGAGRDVFLYDGTFDSFDLIWDFQLGASGDVLDLHAFLDNFSIPDDPFSGGHLSFIASGSNTLVRVDADGPGGPGSQFQLVTLLNVTLTVANTDNYIV